MADPESRQAPPKPTFKMIRPGEEKALPAPTPKTIKRGEGLTARFVRPGDPNKTGSNTAYPYETMAAQAKRENREFEARAEVERKLILRDSQMTFEENSRLRATKKRLKNIGITI